MSEIGEIEKTAAVITIKADLRMVGLPTIEFADVDACAKTVAVNSDIAIGVKVRMSENIIGKLGLEPLKRSIAACEKAGTGGKVMVHIGASRRAN